MADKCGADGKKVVLLKREIRPRKRQVMVQMEDNEEDFFSQQNLRHTFKKESYLKPTFCDHCGLMLFGMYYQVNHSKEFYSHSIDSMMRQARLSTIICTHTDCGVNIIYLFLPWDFFRGSGVQPRTAVSTSTTSVPRWPMIRPMYSFPFPIPFQDLSANCGKQTEIGEQSQMGEQNHIFIRGEQRSMLKPGKPGVKVNLSQFKLKTVLGRGGYGKARSKKR